MGTREQSSIIFFCFITQFILDIIERIIFQKPKNMSLTTFLQRVKNNEILQFDETISVITENYNYQPTGFSNGLGDDKVMNAAGTNEGSCKIFAFAQLNLLDQQQTLNLFGDFYHKDVLQDPTGTNHQNIRRFMRDGWKGIVLSQRALTLK